MFRLPDAVEALHAAEIAQRAIDQWRMIEISYVRYMTHTDDNGRKHRRWFAREERAEFGTAHRHGDRPVLSAAPSARVYEPVAVGWTVRKGPVPWGIEWEDHVPYVDVIKHSPNGYIPGRVPLQHVIVRSGSLCLAVSRKACTVRGTGLDPTVKRGADPLNPDVKRV